MLARRILLTNQRTMLANCIQLLNRRHFGGTVPFIPDSKGLVLGVYDNGNYTPTTQKYNDRVAGKLQSALELTGSYPKQHTELLNLDSEYDLITVVGLGEEDSSYNSAEQIDEKRENTRLAAAVGALKLQENGIGKIYIDDMGDPESVAEGAGLALWNYQVKSPSFHLFHESEMNESEIKAFRQGLMKAQAQNIARQLSSSPANQMTPYAFTEAASKLCEFNVNVVVRDKSWAEENNMEAFLAVSKGSCEDPYILEMSYCGRGPSTDKSVLIIGKGVTFDAGGLNLKQCKKMAEMRGDMAGAAVIVGALRIIAALETPININVIIPLCENMMSGQAMRPLDVLTTKSGKEVKVTNTSHEGRLILADAITYGMETYRPEMLIDIATFSHHGKSNLGSSATPLFTNNDDIWEHFNKAGALTGDRMWRMPLWNHFSNKLYRNSSGMLQNTNSNGNDDMCYAAAFLNEFVTCTDFVHMDIGGTGMIATEKDFPYLLENHMTGRPTRTIIQFFQQIASLHGSVKAHK